MLSNVSDMLAMVDKERPGTPVVLCSIPPSANPKAPIKAADRTAMNDGLRKLAAGRKGTFFCDLFAATANEDGSIKAELFAADKLHLSAAGHRKWAELLEGIFGQMEKKVGE
jgi:lysophospholipase L1-like esterase